jgi:hypothetical protein
MSLHTYFFDPTSPADLERTANRFAGAFLAPREHLLGEIGPERRVLSYRELIDLKCLYGISGAALLVRLRDLEVITPPMLTHAFQTFARGWRREEPEPLEDERSRGELEAARRFERLLHRAMAEGLIPLARGPNCWGSPAIASWQNLGAVHKPPEEGDLLPSRRLLRGDGGSSARLRLGWAAAETVGGCRPPQPSSSRLASRPLGPGQAT